MIYKSSIWFMDIDEAIRIVPEIKELSEKMILITGAGGLICSAIVDMLLRYNEIAGAKIHITAAGRSEKRISERFAIYWKSPYFQYLSYDASNADQIYPERYDYIIHGAGNAFPAMFVKEPVETMSANIIGIRSLLEQIRRQNYGRILYISSGEIYGKKEEEKSYKEDDYGYIDILRSRNSYAMSKRTAETLCAAYGEEHGIDTVIVRPCHIYGPTASEKDNRVASAWAYAAARGEHIVMKSDGEQIRSYCYCLDCASAILKVLLRGESLTAYNIANPNSIISIRQIAELLSNTEGVPIKRENITARERKSFNPMERAVLNCKRLEKLGWRGLFDMERGLSHTVRILQEVNY